MSLLYYILLAVVLLAVYISYQVIYAFYFSPLKDIPGPRIAALSEAWMLFHAIKLRQPAAIHEAFQRYGPVVRVAPNKVALESASELSLYRTQGYVKVELDVTFDRVPNVFSVTDPIHHKQLLRITNPPFRPTALQAIQAPLKSVLRQLCNRIDAEARATQPLDIWRINRLLSFDVLAESLLGVSLRGVETGTTHPFVADMETYVLRLAAKEALWAPLFKFASYLPIPAWQYIMQADKRMCTYAECVLAEHRHEGIEKRHDMMAHLQSAIDPKTGQPMTSRTIAGMVALYMLAGSDTTATTLSYMMYEIARRPDVYAMLRAELVAVISDAEGIPETLPDANALKALPVLQAVYKETLRRYAPAPLYLPRVVPESGGHHGGHFFPAGTVVGVQSWTLHRDAKVFPDPEAWNPSRWLEQVEGKTALRDSTEMDASFIPLGTGLRQCQGRPLADVEILSVIATLVRRYKFRPHVSTTPESMREVHLITIRPVSKTCKLVFEENL